MPDETEIESKTVTCPAEGRDLIERVLGDAIDYAAGVEGGHLDIPPREEIAETDLSRLVRVDKLCLALHLMAARYALRDQPNVLLKIQEAVLAIVERFGAVQGTKVVVKKVGWRAIPGVGFIALALGQIKSFFDTKATQNALMRNIRIESRRVREELALKTTMKTGKRRRTTRRVYTRHPSPLQREQNKSWHPSRT